MRETIRYLALTMTGVAALEIVRVVLMLAVQ